MFRSAIWGDGDGDGDSDGDSSIDGVVIPVTTIGTALHIETR